MLILLILKARSDYCPFYHHLDPRMPANLHPNARSSDPRIGDLVGPVQDIDMTPTGSGLTRSVWVWSVRPKNFLLLFSLRLAGDLDKYATDGSGLR